MFLSSWRRVRSGNEARVSSVHALHLLQVCGPVVVNRNMTTHSRTVSPCRPKDSEQELASKPKCYSNASRED